MSGNTVTVTIDNKPVVVSVTGLSGLSAYELWLAAGNTGTLQQFLLNAGAHLTATAITYRNSDVKTWLDKADITVQTFAERDTIPTADLKSGMACRVAEGGNRVFLWGVAGGLDANGLVLTSTGWYGLNTQQEIFNLAQGTAARLDAALQAQIYQLTALKISGFESTGFTLSGGVAAADVHWSLRGSLTALQQTLSWNGWAIYLDPDARKVVLPADWNTPKSIMVIGDSFSDSLGATGTWAPTAAAAINGGTPLVTVARYSSGSKMPYRTGVTPVYLTLAGNTLPASGSSVAVSLINGAPPSDANDATLLKTFDGDTSTAQNTITGMLGGRHVTLQTQTNGSYNYTVFQDAGFGSVPIPAGSLFVPDFFNHLATDELWMLMSENYFYSGQLSTTPGVPDHVNPQVYIDIDLMIRRARGQRIIILGLLPDASWTPGTPQAVAVRAFNDGLKARWPQYYAVDAQGRDLLARFLASGNGSTGDNLDISNGVTPRSLRRDNGGGNIDSLHPGVAGNALMAQFVAEYRALQVQPPAITSSTEFTLTVTGGDSSGSLQTQAVIQTQAPKKSQLQSDVDSLKLTSAVGGSPYYPTRAAGAASTAVGQYFVTNESGVYMRYQRTSTSPFYDAGTLAFGKGDVGLDQVANLGPADLPPSNAVLSLLASQTASANSNIVTARGQSTTVPTIADIGNLTWTTTIPKPTTLVTIGQTSIMDQKGSVFQYIGVINANFKNRNYRVQDASGNVWTKITPVIPYADRSLAQGLAVQQARNAAYTFATVSDLPKKRIAGDLVLSDTTFMTLPVAGTRYWPRDTLPISQVPAGTARLYTTGLVVENRRPNLIPYPNFDGAVVGIVGSGGAIPTGSDRATADVLEVISLTTDANGIKTFVYETRRTGGSPVASSSTWRVRALGDPITPSAGMGVAFHGFATVLNATGATAVVFSLQELTSAGVFVATHAYYLRLDGVQDRPVIHAMPATPGNKFIPSITTYTTTTTSDYTVRVAVELMKVEESIEPRDITTWTESGKVTTASPNLVTNTGAALGVVGSGGALPTGWDRSNTSDVVTILQLSPLRIQVARGSGSTTTSLSLRPVSYANRVQNTSGAAASYALRTGIKVISATAVDAVAAYVQELTSADANVGSTSITLPQDGTANLGTPTRSIANTDKAVPGIGIYYQSSANFSIVIEFSELPSFGLAQIAYPATLVEAPILTGAPTGSFDILQLSANTSVWSLGVALAGSITLTLPKQRSLQIVKQAILLPAGSSWQQRTDIVDGLNPIAFEQLPISDSLTSIGGQQCGVNSAQQPWSMMRASNRNRVMRYEVRSGDHWSQDVTQDGGVTHRERCELKIGTSFFTYDVDQWIAWSFMLLPGAPVVEVPVQGDYCSLGQTHDGTITNEKNYSNMLGTGMWQDDRWGIFANTNPDSTTTTNYQTVINYQDSDPTPRGVWQNMVARIRPSLANTGRVQIYKNAAVGGLPVIDYTGPLGFSGSPGWYWKEGIYRGERAATLAVLFANLEFGSDLSGLVGNPRDIA